MLAATGSESTRVSLIPWRTTTPKALVEDTHGENKNLLEEEKVMTGKWMGLSSYPTQLK